MRTGRPGDKIKRGLSILAFLFLTGEAWALVYPGVAPGSAKSRSGPTFVALENQILRGQWNDDGTMVLTDKQSNVTLGLGADCWPHVKLADGSIVNLRPDANRTKKESTEGFLLAASGDRRKGLAARWTVSLAENDNAMIATLELTASRPVEIAELVFLKTELPRARQVGQVDGSVVVCGNWFMAVEHPLAKNSVDTGGHVRCSLPRNTTLTPGDRWKFHLALGVAPAGQLRRGFLYYVERRRAHPYRQFLHYNSWYHLNIGRPDSHMTEAECLDAVDRIGRELVTRRGVDLDAFVWDDGWDDFNSLWGFHSDFPRGFERIRQKAAGFHADLGVWMSPWGGYGGPKQARLAFGRSQGYETNDGGYSMAGSKYRAAFRQACLRMIRQQGVRFFKFDGMGTANSRGPQNESAADVDAVLQLAAELRRTEPDLFISATVGTWASPFWTWYADSIWRQGGDTGFQGSGDTRQQWITYRDMYCYRKIVQWGPLYPLNSLMLHGPCIGERANPAKMIREESSMADEIWSFFGSGTNLQELYISPHLLTPVTWDNLAHAARWSRANSDVLVDTHWVGGDPGLGEVYGWASWQPRKGIVTLRNPSPQTAEYDLVLSEALELPPDSGNVFEVGTVRPPHRLDRSGWPIGRPLAIKLQPWEVVVLETAASD